MNDKTQTNSSGSINLLEGGGYVQVITFGAYAGWNEAEQGIAIGVFSQLSAGVAGVASGGVIISSDGFKFVHNEGGGIATPTGLGPFSAATFLNRDGSLTTQVGGGWTDLVEIGGYV